MDKRDSMFVHPWIFWTVIAVLSTLLLIGIFKGFCFFKNRPSLPIDWNPFSPRTLDHSPSDVRGSMNSPEWIVFKAGFQFPPPSDHTPVENLKIKIPKGQ